MYKIFVITLPERKESVKKVLDNIYKDYEIFNAITFSEHIPSNILNPHTYYCYLSHLEVFKKAIDNKIWDFLLFEDDIECNKNVKKQIKEFEKNVPQNWDILLYGWLEWFNKHKEIINKNITTPYLIRGAHAIRFRGEKLIREIYSKLLEIPEYPDIVYNKFFKTYNVYKPLNTIFVQDWKITKGSEHTLKQDSKALPKMIDWALNNKI